MHPADDAFAVAVARHGVGTWVRCASVAVRWTPGRSLGPLRRRSGCRRARDSKEATAAALRAAFAAVDAAALLQLALRPFPEFGVEFRPGAPLDEAPRALVRGARRWELHDEGVPPNARVAWCVETAASGGRPPTGCPREAFTRRMVALMPPAPPRRERATAPPTAGWRGAQGSSELPDVAAWYEPPSCAAVAMRRCASSSGWLVFFGAMLGQHTMHVQEEVAVPSAAALHEAVAKLCGAVRLPFRRPTPQWVPSVLGARLERVRLVRTSKALTEDDGVTPALRFGDATALFRDASAGAHAQRWLLGAHEARAREARG